MGVPAAVPGCGGGVQGGGRTVKDGAVAATAEQPEDLELVIPVHLQLPRRCGRRRRRGRAAAAVRRGDRSRRARVSGRGDAAAGDRARRVEAAGARGCSHVRRQRTKGDAAEELAAVHARHARGRPLIRAPAVHPPARRQRHAAVAVRLPQLRQWHDLDRAARLLPPPRRVQHVLIRALPQPPQPPRPAPRDSVVPLAALLPIPRTRHRSAAAAASAAAADASPRYGTLAAQRRLLPTCMAPMRRAKAGHVGHAPGAHRPRPPHACRPRCRREGAPRWLAVPGPQHRDLHAQPPAERPGPHPADAHRVPRPWPHRGVVRLLLRRPRQVVPAH